MEDRLGNAEASTAADLGGLYHSEAVTCARRALLNARELRYPIVLVYGCSFPGCCQS